MKIVNPLHYPLAVLIGGVVLVTAVRWQQLSPWIMLPVATGITAVAATLIQAKSPETSEIQAIQQQAHQLALKSTLLRQESGEVLGGSSEYLNLLTTIHYACDRALELPDKVAETTNRLTTRDPLLSLQELEQQLKKVEKRIELSSGSSKQQLQQLATSLKRNQQLAKSGEDARQAQLISISTSLTDTAGVLLQLQNQLRTVNLQNTTQIAELQSLSEELTNFQDNLDLLISP